MFLKYHLDLLDILNVKVIFSDNGQNECHEVGCGKRIDFFNKLNIWQKFINEWRPFVKSIKERISKQTKSESQSD